MKTEKCYDLWPKVIKKKPEAKIWGNFMRKKKPERFFYACISIRKHQLCLVENTRMFLPPVNCWTKLCFTHYYLSAIERCLAFGQRTSLNRLPPSFLHPTHTDFLFSFSRENWEANSWRLSFPKLVAWHYPTNLTLLWMWRKTTAYSWARWRERCLEVLFIFVGKQQAIAPLAQTAAAGWPDDRSTHSYGALFTCTGTEGKRQRHLSVVCFHNASPSFTPSVAFLCI